jgi:uncharacterized protein (TIGR00304 family)
LIAASIISGEGQVGLFLIFPFVFLQGEIGAVGIFLVIIGMFCLLIGISTSATEIPESTAGGSGATASQGGAKKNFGGVVFIGPIPIIFGSDAKMANIMLMLAAAIVITFVLVFLIMSMAGNLGGQP